MAQTHDVCSLALLDEVLVEVKRPSQLTSRLVRHALQGGYARRLGKAGIQSCQAELREGMSGAREQATV